MSALGIILAAALATDGVGAAESADRVDAAGATSEVAKASSPARITSDTTYYDRKEGIAVFKGNVHVDDCDYQMHAKRAYVFMNVVSNSLSRIAALGSVALTNGTKRAYGEKVTYHREDGLVVLHGTDANPAVVLDETPDGPRTAKGRKIRFWINREQVEVTEAVLTAPRPEGGGLPFSMPGSGK